MTDKLRDMNFRTKNRLIRLTILCIAGCVTFAYFRLMDIALRPSDIRSGLFLYGLISFLALYNLRKRIRFIPLGSSETWLQLHIYVAIFTGLLFGVHVSWHWPQGIIEVILAVLYLATFVSGVFGLVLSRTFAKRLSSRGTEVIFERIPAHVYAVQCEVESLVMKCLAQTDSTAIPRFYADRLLPFFAGPRHVFQHVVHSTRPKTTLLREIEGFERYLTKYERSTMADISDKVSEKDNLDYQYALQLTLKSWLMAHVPLTYALLVFATVHLLLVFAFSGRVG